MKADELIGAYVALRDEIKAVEDRQKAELAPYKGLLDNLESALMELLHASGGSSIKATGVGTAYLSELTSYKLADREAFRDYVIQHQDWDVVDLRVNRTAAKERDALPGVTSETIVKVNVRRS